MRGQWLLSGKLRRSIATLDVWAESSNAHSTAAHWGFRYSLYLWLTLALFVQVRGFVQQSPFTGVSMAFAVGRVGAPYHAHFFVKPFRRTLCFCLFFAKYG